MLRKGRVHRRVALTGRVSSQEEDRMGGVLVRRQAGGLYVSTTTIVSDAQGKYSISDMR